MNSERSISPEAAAKFLGVSVSELQQLSDTGQVKYHKTKFSGHTRFYESDLKLLKNRKQKFYSMQ